MLSAKSEVPNKSLFELDYIGIKAPQFSFSRLSQADPILGVDMSSTGEVGCIGEDYYDALLKSMLSVGYKIPKKNILLSTGPVESKADLLSSVKLLVNKGYNLFSTGGTHKFLKDNNVESQLLYWPDQKESPNTLEYLRKRKIDLVINIPKDHTKNELDNDYTIRRSAIDFNIPLITNSRLAQAFINAFCKKDLEDISKVGMSIKSQKQKYVPDLNII
jgi:carbamoyl-phosphate synthase large subunit